MMIGTFDCWRIDTAHLPAVDIGKTEIEQDHVVAVIGDRLHGGAAGGDVVHEVAVGDEAFGERRRDRPIVLDEQHLHGHSLLARQSRTSPFAGSVRHLGRFLDEAGTEA